MAVQTKGGCTKSCSMYGPALISICKDARTRPIQVGFESPAELSSWSPGLKDASTPPPICVQFTSHVASTQSEDCLFLNVFTPKGQVNTFERLQGFLSVSHTFNFAHVAKEKGAGSFANCRHSSSRAWGRIESLFPGRRDPITVPPMVSLRGGESREDC